MNPERRPLLMNAEVQGRSARPETRYSPDDVHVNVTDDDGMTRKKRNCFLFPSQIVHFSRSELFISPEPNCFDYVEFR